MDLHNYVREVFFDNYYRVLVVHGGSEYTVSVDVYHVGWIFTDYRERCIDNICLLIAEAPIPHIEGLVVKRVLVIGIRVGERAETINVKWFIDKNPTTEDLERIYKYSWMIVRGVK